MEGARRRLGTTRAHRIVEVVCAPPRRHWQAYWYVALFGRTVIVAGSGQHKGCNGCRLTGSEGGNARKRSVPNCRQHRQLPMLTMVCGHSPVLDDQAGRCRGRDWVICSGNSVAHHNRQRITDQASSSDAATRSAHPAHPNG